MAVGLERLQQQLEYRFKNIQLLKTSLTHTSTGQKESGRLEFIGDAVLGLCITQYIYQAFRQSDEGALSRHRAYLVQKTTLASLAGGLGLADLMVLGGQFKTRDGITQAMLADTFEAVLGAIYLDGSTTECFKCVIKLYQKYLPGQLSNMAHKDFKTQLQEFCQAQKRALPHYQGVVLGAGDDQGYQVSVHMAGREFTRKGATKKDAEQAIAQEILYFLMNKE